MRIYWDTGTRTYDSAREVKEELTRRGLLEVSLAPVAVEDTPEAQVHIAMERQRKEGVWRQDPQIIDCCAQESGCAKAEGMF